jgi:hypothetical protein
MTVKYTSEAQPNEVELGILPADQQSVLRELQTKMAQIPDSVAGKSTEKARSSLNRFINLLVEYYRRSAGRLQQGGCYVSLPGNNIRSSPRVPGEGEPNNVVEDLDYYSGDAYFTHKYINKYIDSEGERGWYYVTIETLGKKGWVAFPEDDVPCDSILPFVDYDVEGRPKLTSSGTIYIRCDNAPHHLWGTPSDDDIWGMDMGILPNGTRVEILGTDFKTPNETWWRQVQVEANGESYIGWVLLQNLVPDPCGNPGQASLRKPEGVKSEVIEDTLEQLMGILDYEAGQNPQQIVDIAVVVQNRMRLQGLSLNAVLNDPGQFQSAGIDFVHSWDYRLYGAGGSNAKLLGIVIGALLADQDLLELDLSEYGVTVPGMPDTRYGLYTYATLVENVVVGEMPSEQDILVALGNNTTDPECICDVRNLIVGWTPLASNRASTVIFRADPGCAAPGYWSGVIERRIEQRRAEPGHEGFTAEDAIRELRNEKCHSQY